MEIKQLKNIIKNFVNKVNKTYEINNIKINENLLYEISNYDYLTYNYIKYNHIRLYFIITNLLKCQCVRNYYNIRELIKYNDDDHYNYNFKEIENIIKDTDIKINNIINQINKDVNDKEEIYNNEKYEKFNKKIKCSLIDFIQNILKNKEDINKLNEYVYMLLNFYITEIKEDYDEGIECPIINLMLSLNNYIFCILSAIKIKEHI
jgi:hypothetical protein